MIAPTSLVPILIAFGSINSAFAIAVGDKVTYRLPFLSAQSFSTSEVVSIKDDKVIIKDTLVTEYKTEVTTQVEPKKHFDIIETYFKNCVQYGGTFETTSVAAGTFPACRFTSQYGDYYAGLVPFVRLKSTYKDGTTEIELIDYSPK